MASTAILPVGALVGLIAFVSVGHAAQAQDSARESASAYVRGTGVANGQTPAARWTDPVCPKVLGLRQDAARAAETRIRTIASRVGATVADEPCNSNLVVTFTSDPGAVAREVDRNEPRQFSHMASSVRDRILNGNAPIRWWYLVEERGRHGEGERQPGTSGQGIADNHAGDNGSYAFEGDRMQYDSSLISTMVNRVLTGASILVDQDRVDGMRLDTIAAYAALVGLAEIRRPDFAPTGSILGIFSGTNEVVGLTAQDSAFLRTLYSLPLDREASRHRGALIRGMTESAVEP